jgi:hypothetical protein
MSQNRTPIEEDHVLQQSIEVKARRRDGRLVAAVVAVLLSTVGAVVAQASAVYADQAGKGGDFVPLSPSVTVLDTRTSGGGNAPVGQAGSRAFQVAGVGGIPTTGVSAVLVDLTAISPSGTTYLTLWPDGGPSAAVRSMVNARPGQILSNTAVVPVGAGGRVVVYNNVGNTHVLVEVQGYFTTSSGGSGGGFFPVDHTRLVDTRSGLGTNAAAIPSGGTRTVTLTGGIIPAGAAAAFLDVIVTNATVGGWLGAYPAGGSHGNHSAMDFYSGITEHGISVRLSANGQATFSNQSGGPIHLILTAEGYFSSNSSQGAGMRPITIGRLLDTRATPGTPLPRDGTIDVQVGGAHGLPTRGIAAAALNLTVTDQTESGFLLAWPVGSAEPTTSLTNFARGGGARAGSAVVKVGTEGKIRIKNISPGTVHVIVDLEGWFADPLPGVPIAQNTRVSVLQLTPSGPATLGSVEYAYVDNLGIVRHGRQSDPNSLGSVVWTPLSGLEAFTGPPAVSQLPDGRVQVTAQHMDSNVRSVTQTAVDSPSWNQWALLGGSTASPPVAGKLPDGTTVLFAVDADGRLWAYPQTGAIPSWRSLGSASLGFPVSLATVSEGIRVVGVDNAGAAKAAVYRNDGTFSAWTGLGGTGLRATPAVVVYPGSRARVFVRQADGTIVTKVQDGSGAFPATWQPVGTLNAAGSPAAILDPVRGLTVVVARGSDNATYGIWETAPNTGVWGDWTVVNGESVVTDPTVTTYTNSNGTFLLVVARNLNGQVHYTLLAGPPSAAALAQRRAGGPAPFVTGTLPKPPDVQ